MVRNTLCHHFKQESLGGVYKRRRSAFLRWRNEVLLFETLDKQGTLKAKV